MLTTIITNKDGSEYMTVTKTDDRVQFLNFGVTGYTIMFTPEILPQLIEALQKIQDSM